MRDRVHLVALALFAAVGVFVFDDYGISVDAPEQRGHGDAAVRYILGDEDALLGDEDAQAGNYSGRFKGVAFEIPLIVAERALRLEGSRARYLSRHLLTHLFFLAAGFFAWLLAHRLFGSRLVALLAMLLFLLHPRMYAHSFFNSKDLPFLSAFMIALYLIHRAFRRDTVWAFALCGAGVGLLTNVRIIGAMPLPAVLGMLALDAFFAVRRGEPDGAKRALARAGAFAAASAATLYATMPLLWRDPLSLIEGFAVVAANPLRVTTLFRGEIVQWPSNMPWDYVPTWALITTPPVALLLAALGTAYLARLCAADWRGALANSTARFGLLAAACIILPVAAVALLNSNLYNGWRHMYFLYAPACVLAMFGLRSLFEIPKPRLRAAAFALAALGLALAAVQTVRLHPYQNDYFNALADKSDLADRWEMDYWAVSYKEALETLLKAQPDGLIAVSGHEIHMSQNMRLIPERERRRLVVSLAFPSFRIVSGDGLDAEGEVIWKREIYGVPIVSILDTRAESAAAPPAIYAATRAREPSARGGGFDIYADSDKLTYIKEDCGEEDARGGFFLSVFPADPSDLPWPARDAGYSDYEPLGFDFSRYGAMFDGKCVIVRGLRDYPIARVETGRRTPGESGAAWSVEIRMDGYYETFRRALAGLSDEPAARSGFDIWLDGGRLIYVKENCGEEYARGRFFLSVFPADPSDLPQSARDAGHEHEPLNFDFDRYGAILDRKCVIIRELPDYPISLVQTGQWIPGEGELWSAEIAVGD